VRGSAALHDNSSEAILAKRETDDPTLLSLGDEKYDLSPLTDSLGFLTRVVHIQMREFIRSLGTLATSPTVYSMLVLVEANPGIRQVRVAEILSVQESNMATLVKELTAANLIGRDRTASNRRAGGLWLTRQGQRLVAEVRMEFKKIDRDYSTSLSEAEYRQLTALLRRVFQTTLRSGLPETTDRSSNPTARVPHRTAPARKA
jgi:DNA-binding MarR family transcriptional regulator